MTSLLVAGCGGDQVRLAAGDPAPDFTLRALDGGSVHLATLRGQVVAVRFWADWCRFCDGEMRALQPVYLRLQKQGFQLLAVNVGQERGKVERFARRLEISYPALLDPESEVTTRYGVIALPTTVLVDRTGKVRGKILGGYSADAFEVSIRNMLDEP